MLPALKCRFVCVMHGLIEVVDVKCTVIHLKGDIYIIRSNSFFSESRFSRKDESIWHQRKKMVSNSFRSKLMYNT